MNLIGSSDTFVLRLNKQLATRSELFFVIGCTNTDTKVTKVMGGTADVLDLKPDPCEEMPFCSSHYMKWYKHNHTSYTRCKICFHYIEQHSS